MLNFLLLQELTMTNYNYIISSIDAAKPRSDFCTAKLSQLIHTKYPQKLICKVTGSHDSTHWYSAYISL